MHFVHHPQQTRDLGAPEGWDHSKVHCGSLSIKDYEMAPGVLAMESRWVPDGFEAARLALGEADIRLSVIGRSHPPVTLRMHMNLNLSPMERQVNLTRLLNDLLEYAQDEGLQVSAVSGGKGSRKVVVQAA